MKIKYANPAIFFGFILLQLISLFIAIVIDNYDIVIYLTLPLFLSLSFIYLPILTILLYSDKIDNKNKIINTIGVTSIFFLFIGLILKVWHLPGASILFIIGSSLFCVNFLPSWYVARFKIANVYERIIYFIFCSFLGLFAAFHAFKFNHWPGASIFYNLTLLSCKFALLPTTLFVVISNKKLKLITINHQFIFGFIMAFMSVGILSASLVAGYFSSDIKAQRTAEKNLTLYTMKCDFFYHSLENDSSFKKNNDTYIAIVNLKNISDSIFNYIKILKAELVMRSDNIVIKNIDSIKFETITTKADKEICSNILIGDNYSPNTGKYSALELKSKLISYNQRLLHILPQDIALQIKQSNPIELNGFKNAEGEEETWENALFYRQSLSMVFTILTNFQASIRFNEMSALSELFNQLNQGNENLAKQLVDLNIKYENEKQEKKITMLQKDKELDLIKLKAKDTEIENREKMIFYFVVAILIFSILTVFVFRINFLRKKTNQELTRKKSEIEHQKLLIEEKQKEIVDSIIYAKRLQQAILVKPEEISKVFNDNLLLYLPKDIVAGDFYFFETTPTHIFYAAADCTGHGVPGALVSVVCSNALTRCIKEFQLTEPGKILDKTRELVLATFTKSGSEVKDGMDISLIVIDKNEYANKNNKDIMVRWSGANNPIWYIHNNQIHEISATKQSIGYVHDPKPFQNHEIKLNFGDYIYLFTDGYADQFGGPKSKKFKYKNLQDLLLELTNKINVDQNQNMKSIASVLENTFITWKGELEQTDDVCVMGLKI